MKNTHIFILAAAVCLTACAKAVESGPNDANKPYFESWIKINHPNAKRTPMGVYVVSETPGKGDLVGAPQDDQYLRMEYTTRDLKGAITSTTSEDVAKQIGSYDKTTYYGPQITYRGGSGMFKGLEEVLPGMRVGGSSKFVIPGWLMTNSSYSTEQEYLDNVTGDDTQYDMKIVEIIPDITKWEIDSLVRYLGHNYPKVNPADTSSQDNTTKMYGFYFIQTKKPTVDKAFPNDTTFYINYTGRLLNGTVFDTSVKDTAKVYGIYSASKTYEPQEITMAEQFSDIQMGGSSTITGFSFALHQMHPFEKCTCIFYSTLGYKSSGSGSSIPGYSPLRFDIEVVAKP